MVRISVKDSVWVQSGVCTCSGKLLERVVTLLVCVCRLVAGQKERQVEEMG